MSPRVSSGVFPTLSARSNTMRILRTTQLLSVIVLSSILAPVNVCQAGPGASPPSVRSSLLDELNAALTKLDSSAKKLDSIGTSIAKVRTDVNRLAADFGTGSTSAVNTKLLKIISSRVDGIQKRVDQVKMELTVLRETFGKIQNEATAAKMPIIARLAARAVTEVDALRKRSVADQVKIDQLRKDIRKLSERKATDP